MSTAIGVLRAVDAAFTQEAATGAFIKSQRFQGRKEGYLFQTGPSGTGYYTDPRGGSGKGDDEKPSGGDKPSEVHTKDAGQLLEEAEALAEDLADLENIDDRGIRRVVAGLERRVKRNTELRIKYADAPERFLESELEVDEIVRKLVALAGEPELYAQLMAHASAPLLLDLLHHANLDIVCAAVDLLQELLDADVVEDLDTESQQLVDALLEAAAIELMTQRLVTLKERASEEEEAAAHSILTCFQSMVEIDGRVAAALGANDDLFKWLLQRLNPRVYREFTATKAAAAETLAIMVQEEESNRVKLMKVGGINAVLVAIEPYRKLKGDLKEQEEEEYVHELCNVLGACLTQAATRDQFLDDQGVELMLLLARGTRSFRLGAIKVLNYATTDCAKAADRVIDYKGLPCIFGAFMGKKKTKGVKAGSDDARGETEHVMSIICNLLQNASSRPKRERVAAKFVENEFEKCDRLMELFYTYQQALQRAMTRLLETGEDDPSVIDLTLRTSGKFIVEQICLIFGHLWAMNDALLRKRLLLLLHQKSLPLSIVRTQLEDVYAGIEYGSDKDKALLLANKVSKLITALGGAVEAPKALETATEASALASEAPPLPPDDPAPGTPVETSAPEGIAASSNATEKREKVPENGSNGASSSGKRSGGAGERRDATATGAQAAKRIRFDDAAPQSNDGDAEDGSGKGEGARHSGRRRADAGCSEKEVRDAAAGVDRDAARSGAPVDARRSQDPEGGRSVERDAGKSGRSVERDAGKPRADKGEPRGDKGDRGAERGERRRDRERGDGTRERERGKDHERRDGKERHESRGKERERGRDGRHEDTRDRQRSTNDRRR